MAYHHGFSIADLEEMTPWEFEVYITHTRNYIQKLEDQQRHGSSGGSNVAGPSSAMLKQMLVRAEAQKKSA